MLSFDSDGALQAVIYFLEIYYKQTKSKDTALIIKELKEKHSSSVIWQDWRNIFRENTLQANKKDKLFFTEKTIFEGMIKFLEKFYLRTKSDDIGSLLGDLLHAEYGETSDPAAWHEWQNCLRKVKTEEKMQ